MQLVLDTTGLQLHTKRGSFWVVPEHGQGKLISPGKLTSIAITRNCLISSSAIRLAAQKEIPIFFFNRIGKAEARLWSPYFGSIATLRRQQIEFANHKAATKWIIGLFFLKAEQQIENLRFLIHKKADTRLQLKGYIQKIDSQTNNFKQFGSLSINDCQGRIMGTEGAIARMYWQGFGNSLPEIYRFEKRSRRPAADDFNAALNYLYGMLYTVVESAIFATGLDPYLGLLHSDEYAKPVLSYDLIEPFRPWVDRLLAEQCFKNHLLNSFFDRNDFNIFLNKKGKAFIIPLFNEFLRSLKKFQHRETSVKNHIYRLAGQLASQIRNQEYSNI